jgi:TonB family protein
VSEDPTHGASKIHASKEGGGNGAKWLLGAVAAVVLVGGGYAAWKNFSPSQNNNEIAYNDDYAGDDALRASALNETDNAPLADSASLDETAAPASTSSSNTANVRRAPPRTAASVPEETIGITPASYTTGGADDIVVTAPRRPIWARTPNERRLSALYPERALARGREGEARLTCVVQDGGALDCDRVSETPGGFGAAAVRVARTFRHAPQLADGSNAIGTPVNLRVVFRIDDDPRGRG